MLSASDPVTAAAAGNGRGAIEQLAPLITVDAQLDDHDRDFPVQVPAYVAAVRNMA